MVKRLVALAETSRPTSMSYPVRVEEGDFLTRFATSVRFSDARIYGGTADAGSNPRFVFPGRGGWGWPIATP